MRKTVSMMALAGTCLALIFPMAQPCAAREIYVNNRLGSDAFDGHRLKPHGQLAGPLKTIDRALRMARAGDTIILANTGETYYEDLQLNGTRHGAKGIRRFVIEGNGAVVSGARRFPAKAWKKVSDDLWKVTTWRKGHYNILRDGKPLPEHPCPKNSSIMPEIPRGSWCAWRGVVYFHAERLQNPNDMLLAFGYDEVGISLFEVDGIFVRNLTLQHFRLDGINTTGTCRDVVFENVIVQENGRAGLAVSGSAQVVARKCEIKNNREHSVLVTELGAASLEETTIDAPATLVD